MNDPDPGLEPGLEARLRGAAPALDDVAGQLVRARAAAALFGGAEPVRVGRYEIERQAGGGGGGVVFAAWDPELSRRVAVKLIRAGGERNRVLAEGHTLARLSHPNVVPIFDVGSLGNQVYLVMELVEGQTLRAHIATRTLGVREIVAIYRQAGAGLAAAHRAGIVHRDFKPDNALVGDDGRVRVVDFGLARAGDATTAVDPGGDGTTTRAGIGTPRYMAPEQAAGGAITPAADQYAFCVSLREAVTTAAARATRERSDPSARTEEGAPTPDRRAVPRDRPAPLPRWIDLIVTRGTALRPEDRFPDLAAVLRELERRDPATRWRRRGLALGALGLAATAFVVGRAGDDTGPSCDGGPAAIDPTWSAPARAEVGAHLDQLATPYAARARPLVLGALDRYRDAWIDGHRGACVAHRSGAQSAPLLDRRMACLDHARAALAAAVEVARTASATELPAAQLAVGELPDLGRCAAPERLLDRVAAPRPQDVAAIALLDQQLAALQVEARAGRPGVRERASGLVVRARALGYAPLIARALRVDGMAAFFLDREAAIPPLREATTTALAAGDFELAVEAFARRAWAEGTMVDPDRALEGLPLIAAIADGLPDSARGVRALLANNIGTVELSAGRHDAARLQFERAIRDADGITGPFAFELLHARTNLARVTTDPVHQRTLRTDAIERLTAAVGADHPDTLYDRILSALLEPDPSRGSAELEPVCSTYLTEYPDHLFELRWCSYELGFLAFDRGAPDAARWFEQAVGAADDPRTVLARGYLDLLGGRPAVALAALTTIRTQLTDDADATWWRQAQAADVEVARGLAAAGAHDRATAIAALERARTIYDRLAASGITQPQYGRRLARVRLELVRLWRDRGALSEAQRAEAMAALAWYRAAGGYDAVVDELASLAG